MNIVLKVQKNFPSDDFWNEILWMPNNVKKNEDPHLLQHKLDNSEDVDVLSWVTWWKIGACDMTLVFACRSELVKVDLRMQGIF